MDNKNNKEAGTPDTTRRHWRPMVLTLLEMSVALTFGLALGDWSLAANLVFGTIRQLGDGGLPPN